MRRAHVEALPSGKFRARVRLADGRLVSVVRTKRAIALRDLAELADYTARLHRVYVRPVEAYMVPARICIEIGSAGSVAVVLRRDERVVRVFFWPSRENPTDALFEAARYAVRLRARGLVKGGAR